MRKNIKEVRQNPGGFVGEQVVETVFGFLLIPLIIAAIALVLFFILGFTTLLGGPMGFFKVLFIIGFIVALILFAILRPVIRLIKRGTKKVVETGVKKVKNEFN